MSKAKIKTKTKKDHILKEIKAEQAKRNITFSISKELLDYFREDCIENEVRMNQVVEKLIKNYLGV